MAIIRGLLLLLIGAVFVAAAQPAAAQRDDADRYLRRGAYVDRQIWLLTDRGTLFRIDELTRRRTDEDLPDDVLDICRRDGELLAATGLRDRGDWTLRRRRRGAWRIITSVDRSGDTLLAMDCSAGAPITLLTTSRLIEIGHGEPKVVRLPDMIYARVNLTTLGTVDRLYVGINSGEWGGGIVRVDRTSGAIARIERNATADTCHGGPVNTACDPVHAIVTIPWRPNCIAVAIGLVHFMSHGRIAEICGDRVESLYSREIPLQLRGDAQDGRDDTTSSAFFGVVRAGDTLLAAGVDGLYRIGRGGLVDFSPYPAFREIRGVRLNLDQADVILAVTQINRRASLSGGAPLMIPR